MLLGVLFATLLLLRPKPKPTGATGDSDVWQLGKRLVDRQWPYRPSDECSGDSSRAGSPVYPIIRILHIVLVCSIIVLRLVILFAYCLASAHDQEAGGR